MNDVLFRNETVFDGHRFLPAGTVVRVRGRPDHRSWPG